VLLPVGGEPRPLMLPFKEITAPTRTGRALRETEARLRRSEQHLKHAQRIANTGSVERDLTTGVSVWSDELYRILGVGRDFPAIFENFLSLVHEEDRAKLAARMRSIADLKPGMQVKADEYRIVRPDGEIRVIQPVWEAVFDDRGNATHLFAALKDVTELRAAEKRQTEIEQGQFREIAESLLQGIFVYSGDEILYANPAFLQILGYDSFDELRRVTATDTVYPDDWPGVQRRVAARMAGQVMSDRAEFRLRRRDGSLVWVEAQARRFAWNGRSASLSGVSDISARKRAEDALHRSQEHLEQAQRIGGIGSSERDLVTGERIWSEELCRMIGVEHSLVPSDANVAPLIHEEDRARILEAVDRAISGSREPPTEFRIIRPDGEVRTLYREMDVLRDQRGKPIRLLSIFKDVTELRAAERRQKEMEQQLLHSQKLEALGTLAGGVAHELNNTLVPILALTKITANRLAEGSRERGNLNTVLRASERARDLVQQILAFSRKETPMRQRVDAAALVRSALKLLRASLPSTIQIAEAIDDVAPMSGDPGQLHQVVINLVVNAAQAIGDGMGTIAVTLIGEGGEQRAGDAATIPLIHLSVSDTGCGMDEATLRRIFEPFFTTKPVGVGTGLGLSMVHGIVADHGGRIAVASERGRGTCVEVFLPASAS
jgi:PAS domain S-box-containing protein